tara:strand:- start:13858 stop:14430 length:573 start_codon:yes stop_codon:yes gene_type:complete
MSNNLPINPLRGLPNISSNDTEQDAITNASNSPPTTPQLSHRQTELEPTSNPLMPPPPPNTPRPSKVRLIVHDKSKKIRVHSTRANTQTPLNKASAAPSERVWNTRLGRDFYEEVSAGKTPCPNKPGVYPMRRGMREQVEQMEKSVRRRLEEEKEEKEVVEDGMSEGVKRLKDMLWKGRTPGCQCPGCRL